MDSLRFFYKKFWHLIGDDIVRYCLEVLNNGKSIQDINKINIMFIPKVNSPKSMNQFRLISLCTILYKIISRTIVNRFKKVLHFYVHEIQSAFVSGRQITDNILVVYEFYIL